MKTITKGKNMNNFKKVGLTALAGSLAAISANAAEMSVSGASVLTYTTEDSSEVTGNPWGMKTNLGFTASGEVNGYTVSYMQTSADQFAGMSSARLGVDLGDMGNIAFDQGSGSGLGTIDDKTPTAAEEIWDGLDGTTVGGLVGTAGASGVFNYVNTYSGVKLNAAVRQGSGTKNSDGASSGAGGSAWDFALTGSGESFGIEQMAGASMGLGFGVDSGNQDTTSQRQDEDQHSTAFANYSYGPVTFGAQVSHISKANPNTINEDVRAWGIAFNVNENLSISYGEREVDYDNDINSTDEEGDGVAIAYTMGSMKIAGNRNTVSGNNGTKGSNDEMTEIALSFAF